VLSTGYLTLFKVRGAPVRVHWTTPLLALMLGGFRFVPGIWVGVFILILLHELGHAFFVWRYRLHVMAVEVTGWGGLCRYAGQPTPIQRSIIAWGGVLAQSVVLVAASAYWLSPLYAPTTMFEAHLVDSFIRLNLMLIALNLLPIAPLDGAEAWKLFALLRERRARRAGRSRPRPSSRPSDGRPIDQRDVGRSIRELLDEASRDAKKRD
jgi:Zn-dependent protease